MRRSLLMSRKIRTIFIFYKEIQAACFSIKLAKKAPANSVRENPVILTNQIDRQANVRI